MSDDQTVADSAGAPKRAIRGFGYVYQRGRVWWIRYSHRGRDHRESTGSERETDGWRKLKQRWKQIGRGRFVGPSEDRVTVTQIARRARHRVRDERSPVTRHAPGPAGPVARRVR